MTKIDLDSSYIRELTTQINQLKVTYLRDSSETIVEIGERLLKAREKLSHGDWITWVEEYVNFTIRSADRYIQLSEFAKKYPGVFSELKELGPTKLYVISTLSPKIIRLLTRRKYLPLPGTKEKRTLAGMSVIQFYLTIKKLAGIKEPFDLQTELQSLGRKISFLAQRIEKLTTYRGRVPSDEINVLRERIVSLLKTLDEISTTEK